MEKNDRLRHCLLCGRGTTRIICIVCADRVRREALHEEIDEEKHGKRPGHLI